MSQRLIDLFNALIEINNDRIEGYQTAAAEAKDVELKLLLSKFSQTSEKCKSELANQVNLLGGTVIEGTRITGKFFRAWMEVKTALTGNDRKEILDSCEYGDDVALDTYAKALKNGADDLNSEQHTFIQAQYSLIKADHDKVKVLRDALVAQN